MYDSRLSRTSGVTNRADTWAMLDCGDRRPDYCK